MNNARWPASRKWCAAACVPPPAVLESSPSGDLQVVLREFASMVLLRGRCLGTLARRLCALLTLLAYWITSIGCPVISGRERTAEPPAIPAAAACGCCVGDGPCCCCQAGTAEGATGCCQGTDAAPVAGKIGWKLSVQSCPCKGISTVWVVQGAVSFAIRPLTWQPGNQVAVVFQTAFAQPLAVPLPPVEPPPRLA